MARRSFRPFGISAPSVPIAREFCAWRVTGNGMTVDQLSALCGVSRATAYRWLQSPAKMPAAASRLLAATIAGRFVPATWAGWRFVGDQLVSSTGEAMTAQQVEQWRWYCEWWQQACRENELLRDYIAYLESLVPRATVAKLRRGESRPSATAGHEVNPFFHKPP